MPNDNAERHWDDQDYTDAASTFGDRITAARIARGMTPQQLSRRMGIKPQTLSNWEEDRSEPRANKLQMLAGLLNVSIIWLMSGDGEGPEVDDMAPSAAIDDLLLELREIRVAQTALTNRMARLEKRLRALGEAT